MQRFRHLRRRILVVAFLPLLAGCHTWLPAGVAPQSFIPEERPGRVRVTLSNGSVLTVLAPAIVRDSIIGFTDDEATRTAVSDVRTLDVWRVSVPRTSGLVIFHITAVVTFLALVVHVQPHYRGL